MKTRGVEEGTLVVALPGGGGILGLPYVLSTPGHPGPLHPKAGDGAGLLRLLGTETDAGDGAMAPGQPGPLHPGRVGKSGDGGATIGHPGSWHTRIGADGKAGMLEGAG